MNHAICPYCKGTLKKTPLRKSKCPLCSKVIFVKSSPDNREKRLMTESQANEAELSWSNYHTINKYKQNLKPLGITGNEFESVSKKFNNLFDTYIHILQQISQEHQEHHFRKTAYYLIAIEYFNLGEEFAPFLKAAQHEALMEYKNKGVNKVEIRTAGQDYACSKCLNQEGNIYDINTAIKEMPLPCLNCEKNGFCRCTYLPVL